MPLQALQGPGEVMVDIAFAAGQLCQGYLHGRLRVVLLSVAYQYPDNRDSAYPLSGVPPQGQENP
ncbi:hypothetical protein HPA02_19770 [Bisbaumannia pacifica]|uniref:Uncharacterized protein n=1 Tax=Bisbaumannia pacifica TaxID=77098 RepID=A0A510X8G3_9GAMM|nr:hypothetical protein HPA02_19770 [Halomonas pacifica]